QLRARYPDAAQGWQLVLIGAVEDETYAREVAKVAQGLPVTIIHQATRAQLWHWYERASIYWHAAGYEVDEVAHPEKMEHFGISTVEAMAAGAVPIVIGRGGQREILGQPLAKWLWQTPTEAIHLTHTIMTDESLRQKVAKQARARAKV